MIIMRNKDCVFQIHELFVPHISFIEKIDSIPLKKRKHLKLGWIGFSLKNVRNCMRSYQYKFISKVAQIFAMRDVLCKNQVQSSVRIQSIKYTLFITHGQSTHIIKSVNYVVTEYSVGMKFLWINALVLVPSRFQ